MLGAYKGSLHKALELEAAVYPPEVRLERACNLYAIRALRFHKNHPVKQALRAAVRDELAGSDIDTTFDSNQYTCYILPITQLRSEEHTSELQSQSNLVCRLLLEKKKISNVISPGSKQLCIDSIATLDVNRRARIQLSAALRSSTGASPVSASLSSYTRFDYFASS